MTDDKPTRQRHTPAERAKARLDTATRIAEKLTAARDKAKAEHERLDAEATAAIVRRDHYRGDPDLPPATTVKRPARKGIAVEPPFSGEGAPDAATG